MSGWERGIDKAELERYLADGLSLPEISKLVGRPVGTVGYWVKRHGLVANGSVKFRPGKAPPREELRVHLDAGWSVRDIADSHGVSLQTAYRWLREYDLSLPRQTVRSAIDAAVEAGLSEVQLLCKTHGRTAFSIVPGRSARCKRCRSEAVASRRRRVKEQLVVEAGGACAICGYSRSVAALHFHHIDPETKAFGIAGAGATRSIARSRAEALKCILLCSNCHAEVERGITPLPLPLGR
jgi:transposase